MCAAVWVPLHPRGVSPSAQSTLAQMQFTLVLNISLRSQAVLDSCTLDLVRTKLCTQLRERIASSKGHTTRVRREAARGLRAH